MSSNRLISLSGCGPIFQVQTFEDSVLTKLLFDPQYGFLNLSLPSVFSCVFCLLLFLCRLVSEEIQLLHLVLLGYFFFMK